MSTDPGPLPSRFARLLTDLCRRHGLSEGRQRLVLDLAGALSGGALASFPGPSPVRRPSMHHDGTPVQLSASLTRRGTPGGVRVTFEPGRLDLTVPAQLDHCRSTLDAALAELGWARCRGFVGAMADALAPRSAAELAASWGGAWLGFAVDAEHTVIRLYLDLRQGEALDRWRRIGRAVSSLSGQAVAPALHEIIVCSSETARLVGAGIDCRDGTPAALKLYLGVPQPSLPAIRALAPAAVGPAALGALEWLLAGLNDQGLAMPSQSVTVSYDLHLDRDGTPAERARRFKVDIDATRVLPDDAGSLRLARRLAAKAGLATDELDALDVLTQSADQGRRIQYVGIGLADELVNVSVYVRPCGLSPYQTRANRRAPPAGTRHGGALDLRTRSALRQAAAFLVDAQRPDGRFEDFSLAPGRSDGWMTALVAVALDELRAGGVGEVAPNLTGAAEALARAVTPAGWGYNDRTAADGDSTAFAVRALLRAGYPLPVPASQLLSPFIDERGHGHTYLDPARMGTWAAAHPDITPSIGLALWEADADADLQERLARASLEAHDGRGVWTGFWWHRPYYPTWLNLQWLQLADALDRSLAVSAARALAASPSPSTAADSASLLGILIERWRAGGGPVPESAVVDVLERQLPDGGWPPSDGLLVPRQQAVGTSQGGLDATLAGIADDQRLFTTSLAAVALAQWAGQGR